MTKYYAVGVKETGLILVELNWSGKEKESRVLRWRDIQDVVFKKGTFRHRLAFTAVGGERFTLSFQFLGLFRKNRANALGLASYVEKWSQGLECWAQ